MKVQFFKYQGTGNDFIVIDNRQQSYSPDKEEIFGLCQRRFGIGADGLILLENDDQADFRMVYFNADGNESSMCGNGGRCIVHFAYYLEIISRKCTFMAIDGLHQGEWINDELVKIKMSDVDDIREVEEDFILNTGSPHLVRVVSNVGAVDVYSEGRKIRNSKAYAEEGINVNFITQWGEDDLEIATYERGVEDETLSCGTGVTAAALVAHRHLKFNSPVSVKSKGGDLNVSFRIENEQYTDIWLEGPVKQVYKGEVRL